MENTQKLKTTFFRKFIVSIFGIDKYDKISESTVSSFIGYIILLSVLVLSSLGEAFSFVILIFTLWIPLVIA